MLVVPIVSFAVLLFLVLRISQKLNHMTMGIVLVFLLTTSPTVTRWYVANITDGILTTTVALAIFLSISKSRFWIPLFFFLISAGSATRFSLPFWLVFTVYFMTRRQFFIAVAVLIWSIVNFLPAILTKPNLDFVRPQESQTYLERIFEFVIDAFRLLFVEFAQLAVLDRPLLLVIMAAIYFSLANFRGTSSQLFILMGLAGWLIGALNPVLGVNFRYQLPILFSACWVIIEHLNIRGHGNFINSLNIVRHEVDKKLKPKKHE